MVHVPLIFLLYIFQLRKNPAQFADFMKLVQSPPDYATGVIVCIGLVIATLSIAALTYRYVEVPARNYLNQRFSKPKDKAPAVLEVP